jgi:hypothetical protein
VSLVALLTWRDLLFRAKHLSVAATVVIALRIESGAQRLASAEPNARKRHPIRWRAPPAPGRKRPQGLLPGGGAT